MLAGLDVAAGAATAPLVTLLIELLMRPLIIGLLFAWSALLANIKLIPVSKRVPTPTLWTRRFHTFAGWPPIRG